MSVKYKLIGGPFHARKFFMDENLPPLLIIHNGDGVDHYYKFDEMRAHNYWTFTYINIAQELEIVNGKVEYAKMVGTNRPITNGIDSDDSGD